MTTERTTTDAEPSGYAAELLTEFDSPTFDGASPTRSIAVSFFDEAYRARPPWDIDGPQPALARLADTGRISGQVLDVGCGAGENALYFASLGLDVTGLDASAVAIGRAQAKAAERGVAARFVCGDARNLVALGERFDTVTDMGLLHVFSDEDMRQVIAGAHGVLRPSGHYWLICFSEHATVPGPRRVTKEHIHALFAHGWVVKSIEPTSVEVITGRGYEQIDNATSCWLADLERL
jgi:2-polyprenyl-3-methyl-5-hydroxy-6-metoxy-1,4-benzoquinol methylase